MSPRGGWVLSPHTGGSSIPPSLQHDVRRRILAYASKKYAGRFSRIDVRFCGRFCYVDAYREPDRPSKATLRVLRETERQYYERLRAAPIHLCRLRYFAGHQRWSLAFYTYSHERYEPTIFPNGEPFGTPEEAFNLCAAIYLT